MNYLFKNTTERDRDNAHARLCATLKVDEATNISVSFTFSSSLLWAFVLHFILFFVTLSVLTLFTTFTSNDVLFSRNLSIQNLIQTYLRINQSNYMFNFLSLMLFCHFAFVTEDFHGAYPRLPALVAV
jgi:hypothetical protein